MTLKVKPSSSPDYRYDIFVHDRTRLKWILSLLEPKCCKCYNGKYQDMKFSVSNNLQHFKNVCYFLLSLFQVGIRKKREAEDGGKRAKTGSHFFQNDKGTFQATKGSLTRSRTLKCFCILPEILVSE